MNYENVITPWGKSQNGYKWMEGITQYGCAGHGGTKVIKKLNDLIPAAFRAENGWYEEDCAAAIPHYFFFDSIRSYCLLHEEEFNAHICNSKSAIQYFEEWNKDYVKDWMLRYHYAEWHVYTGEDMLSFALANKMNHESEESIKEKYFGYVEAIKTALAAPIPAELLVGRTIVFNSPVNYGGEYVSKGTIVQVRKRTKAIRTESGFLCRIPSKESLKRIGYTVTL